MYMLSRMQVRSYLLGIYHMSSEIDNRECVLTMHEIILKYHLER